MDLKKIRHDKFNPLILFILTVLITGCSFDGIEQEDENDVVPTNPPPVSELQPGRILSDENIYINGDGTVQTIVKPIVTKNIVIGDGRVLANNNKQKKTSTLYKSRFLKSSAYPLH